MKNLFYVLSLILIIIGALATPIAIVAGVYDWVANDNEFKFALWYGLKMWGALLLIGFGGGIPMYGLTAK